MLSCINLANTLYKGVEWNDSIIADLSHLVIVFKLLRLWSLLKILFFSSCTCQSPYIFLYITLCYLNTFSVLWFSSIDLNRECGGGKNKFYEPEMFSPLYWLSGGNVANHCPQLLYGTIGFLKWFLHQWSDEVHFFVNYLIWSVHL